jgi:predicted phage terminase large subunit-like protein
LESTLLSDIAQLPRSQKEEALLILAEKARRSFKDYCAYSDPVYEFPDHLLFLIKKLEAVERGDIRRLMISMPPRHGKTETVSKKFPAWFLGRRPDQNVILSSYSYGLVKDYSRNVRDMIESRLYQIAFNITTSESARAVCDWDIAEHRGGLLAQSVGGGITGYGAHLFIIDDPFKNMQEAESANMREMVWDWYQSVALTRLEPDSRIVLVMTRWNRDDLAGRIQDKEKDWEIVNLPAITEADNPAARKPGEVFIPDPLGRLPGEALWPKRFPAAALGEKKLKVGTRVWAALFQGKPKDPESQRFKREWFQWYDNAPVDILKRGAGIDTATSMKSVNDNTSLVDVIRGLDKKIYVDDVFLEKITVSGFGRYLVNQQKCNHYSSIKLEKNNAGEAFRQRIVELGMEHSVTFPIDCQATSTDKMVRAMEFQPLIENGTMVFKRGNPRVATLVEHLINFDGTGSDVDDDVDALGFAVKSVWDASFSSFDAMSMAMGRK